MVQTTRATAPQQWRSNQIEYGTKFTQELAATYDTPPATGEIADIFRVKTQGLFPERPMVFEGNEDEVGDASEFPNDQYEVSRDWKLAVTARLSAELGALVLAGAMGDVESVVQQIDTFYEHTIIPFVKGAAQGAGNAGGVQAASTGIRYSDGPGQNIASGVVIPDFSIVGAIGNVAELTHNLQGSGTVVANGDPFQTPVPAVNQLRCTNVQIGDAASEESIVDALEEVEVTWNQNLDSDSAYIAGSGVVRGQQHVGNRTAGLKLKFKQHSTDTELVNYLANTALKCIVTYEGIQIPGTETPEVNYGIIVTYYQIKMMTRAMSAGAAHVAGEYEFHVQRDASDNYFDVVANNDATAYLALAA